MFAKIAKKKSKHLKELKIGICPEILILSIQRYYRRRMMKNVC